MLRTLALRSRQLQQLKTVVTRSYATEAEPAKKSVSGVEVGCREVIPLRGMPPVWPCPNHDVVS